MSRIYRIPLWEFDFKKMNYFTYFFSNKIKSQSKSANNVQKNVCALWSNSQKHNCFTLPSEPLHIGVWGMVGTDSDSDYPNWYVRFLHSHSLAHSGNACIFKPIEFFWPIVACHRNEKEKKSSLLAGKLDLLYFMADDVGR